MGEDGCWALSSHVAAHLQVLELRGSKQLPNSREESFDFHNAPFTAPLDYADFICEMLRRVPDLHEGRQEENHCSVFLTTRVYSKQRLKPIVAYLEQQERKDTLGTRSQPFFARESIVFSFLYVILPHSYKFLQELPKFSFFTACVAVCD